MKLGEQLRELGDRFVYVGSGSSFFYIGVASEGIDRIPGIGNDFYQERKIALRSHKKALKRAAEVLPRKLPEAIRATKERLSTHPENRKLKEWLKQLETQLEGLPGRTEALRRAVANDRAYLSAFTPLLEREVLDVCDRDELLPPPGKIIVCSGTENGMWWTWEEYTAGKSEQEEETEEWAKGQ